jgi:hypothetical protein
VTDADVKHPFRIIGNVMYQHVKALPSFDSPEALGNKFAQFLNEKVSKIRTGIDSNVTLLGHNASHSNSSQNTSINLKTHMSGFRLLDESEVQEFVASSANKTCNLDCIPTWLLKCNTHVVLPYITDIVNASLQDGVFPCELKQAIVTPILKKQSLDWNNLQNYRPVSNVNYIGKLIEKAAISQVNDHMENNDLEECMQSAYKRRHSTETALLVVKNNIMKALDENRAVFLVMLDLSAAFDTIDHNILFHRLESDFGIKGTALTWFKSYMTERNYRVSVGGEMSKMHYLKFGVPQGSIIGPRAFTMYSQPVANIIRQYGIEFHIYADDVQLYLSFNPKIPGDSACAIFKLTSCVKEIHLWMSHNKLKLNQSKTEFFIAASQYNMNRLQNTEIHIGSEVIKSSNAVKNLGVIFESTMNMSDHYHIHMSLCKLHTLEYFKNS